jgi:pilus assembly protein TadC
MRSVSLGTSLAAQAVAIASSMESGNETGAALAALSRELRTVMALLSQGVDRGDELDELKAKRDAKRQAASGTG